MPHLSPRRTALVLAAGLALAGCASGEPETVETPTPTPTSTLPPQTPVAGEANQSNDAVNADVILGVGQPQEPDVEQINTAHADIRALLDLHLDDVQSGGPGILGDIAAPGLLDGADPAVVAAASTDLASPEDPVASAAYDLIASYDAIAEWVRAEVTVTTLSGAVRHATYVFVNGDDGPQVVLFGPADGPAEEGAA